MTRHSMYSCWVVLVMSAGIAAIAPTVLADGEKKAGILDILKLKKEAKDDGAKKAEKKAGEEKPAKAEKKTEAAEEKDETQAEKTTAVKEKEKDAKGDAKAGADKGEKKKSLLHLLKQKAVEKKGKEAEKDEGEPATADESVEGDADAAAQGEAEAPEEPSTEVDAEKKEPDPPMFRLRDGTRLAGIPDITFFNINTHYGKLVVPVSEVERVRFAAAQDRELASQIEANVRALGSEEFDRREEAMAALQEIGVAALDALRKALESDDEEVKSRAEKLVAELEEALDEEDEETKPHLTPLGGNADEVVTVKFTVMGEIEEAVFSLQTRYGVLKLNREHILSIVFRESPFLKMTYPVPGDNFAADDKWMDTKLPLSKGQKLSIAASGQITLQNLNNESTGPEGASQHGNPLKDFATGALVGKIGDKGEPFLIGPKYEGTANAEGTLRLGVSLKKTKVSGQYEVEVTAERQP